MSIRSETTTGSMRRVPLLAALVVFLLAVAPPPAGSQSTSDRPFRVIVHPDNPVQTLSRAEVSKIFLKRVAKWNDGLKVTPVDQPVSAPVRETFSLEIHKRSAAKIRSHWQQQIYSGRGVPPAERSSDTAVVEFVAANRTAVGYVSVGTNLGSVRVVEVTE